MNSSQWRIQDFPLGGVPTRWGGANLQRVHFSVKTYVKMKEMDPVGGGRGGACQWCPPGTANGSYLPLPLPFTAKMLTFLLNLGFLKF